MAKIPTNVMDLIKDPEAPKVMATVDKEGIPNVTLKGSLMAISDDTLAFADLCGSKSRTFNNLKESNLGSILVFKVPFAPPFPAYQIKCSLIEYLTSGPMFEQFAKSIKEAIGVDIKGVFKLLVDAVYSQAPQDAGEHIA